MFNVESEGESKKQETNFQEAERKTNRHIYRCAFLFVLINGGILGGIMYEWY